MKRAVLLGILTVTVALSGCIEQDTDVIQYSDDIITIGDYYVSNKNPYPNSPVIMEFYIENNGEDKVTRAEVGFPNYPGFNPESFELSCEATEAVDLDGDADSVREACVFEDLDPQDSRRVLLTANTIDSNPITPKKYTIYYYVEYDYSGFRKIDIPVIDNNQKEMPSAEYSQSTSTYGPIELEFDLPARGEKVVGGETVTEYWGVKEVPFNVEFNFDHVGSSSIGSIRDTVIEPGDVVLDLRDSLIVATDSEGNVLNCDFVEGEDGKLYSDKEIEVPEKMDCTFVSTDFEDPETTASIWVSFDYEYHYDLSEQFELQPK